MITLRRKKKKVWSNYRHNGEVHTIPDNDDIQHVFHDCPCQPVVEPVERDDGSMNWLNIHNALDGRK